MLKDLFEFLVLLVAEALLTLGFAVAALVPSRES